MKLKIYKKKERNCLSKSNNDILLPPRSQLVLHQTKKIKILVKISNFFLGSLKQKVLPLQSLLKNGKISSQLMRSNSLKNN